MPELPDLEVYAEHLRRRTVGRRIVAIRVRSPFVVRTFDPPIGAASGRTVESVVRLGKRLVFALDHGLHLALHLMIAGRLHWKKSGAGIPGRIGLAALDFGDGTLVVTEASTRKRAAIHLVRGAEALRTLDRGGIEVPGSDVDAFREALTRERHTLKRALTDPSLVAGIGNAYSDEILHSARLSPTAITTSLDREETARLHAAAERVLSTWTERLLREAGDEFPERVTAFREGMAVHGRYGKPCPECGTTVQRIVRAENEANYCPRCQTGGRLLADRALSRLLHDDWPKTIDELEERRSAAQSRPPTRKARFPRTPRTRL